MGFMDKVRKYHYLLAILIVGAIMTSGYITSIKLIQLGLPDFGKRILGLDSGFVSIVMVLLGLAGLAGCILMGYLLYKFKWDIYKRLSVLLVGFMITDFLLILTDSVNSGTSYLIWMVLFGLAAGISTPVTFSLMFDLLPQKYRGLISGLFVASIYFLGAASMQEWKFEVFRGDPIRQLFIVPVIFLLIIFLRPFSDTKIEENVNLPQKYNINFTSFLLLLSLILFIDSFGFLRVIGDPNILSETWQGPFSFRLYIGLVHLISAILLGIFYDKIKPLNILLISLILFMVSDFMIGVFAWGTAVKYLYVLLYAPAVSAYTLVMFALIADMSNKDTIFKHIAIGIAIFGWFISYLSTGLSETLTLLNVSFSVHLVLTSALSLVSILIFYFLKRYNKL
ncbi:MAG: MFS transporter [Promethearchaeota archaeon]